MSRVSVRERKDCLLFGFAPCSFVTPLVSFGLVVPAVRGGVLWAALLLCFLGSVMLVGLSYGGACLAWSGCVRSLASSSSWRGDLLALVVEAVHPDNLGALPPSPEFLALKGVQIGLASSVLEFEHRRPF